MADLVVFPIDRTWHTVSSLSKFVVDIVEDHDVVRHGYVCDKSENGLVIKVGSGRQTLVVPYHQLRLPNDSMGDISSITPPDIEVLIDLNTDCEFWQRAKLISFCKCADSRQYGNSRYTYTLLYVSLEDCQPAVANTRCMFIDGDTRITQRARRHGQPSSEITADTFHKLIVPMPQPTRECPDPASSLRKAVVLPRFHECWLSSSYSQFVASSDDHVEVLRLSDSKLTRAAVSAEEDYDRNLVTQCILSSLPDFLERFDRLCSVAVLDMVNDMVSAVIHLQDESDGNDPHFQDLPVAVHLLLLSYLDVYDQKLLKRASKSLKTLLDTLYLQRSVTIPADAVYDLRSLNSANYFLEKESFTLLHIVLRSVTRNVKILYLTGNWINCLLPLTNLLSLMSLKLDWLVIAHNLTLQINEFQSFPQPHFILSDHVAIPTYWNVCRNVALKNVSFSSDSSICFRMHGTCQISPTSRNCCYRPFYIPVSRWLVNLDGSTSSMEQKWNTSVRLMFNNFCSKMSSEEIGALMDWLNRIEMVENLVLWTCICRCFSLWGVRPPGDVAGLRCVIINGHDGFENPPEKDPYAPQRLRFALSRNFPEKNIVTRTLSLLIPHAD